MTATEPHESGTILRVKAQPGGRKNGISSLHHHQLRVAVTQVAERGKANRAIVKLLAKQLGLRGSEISLISGETAAVKRLLIRGYPPKEIDRRIEQIVAELT